MMRSTLTAALAVLPVALATSWDVSVGPNGQLIYYPEYVLAEVGDTINMILYVVFFFRFLPVQCSLSVLSLVTDTPL